MKKIMPVFILLLSITMLFMTGCNRSIETHTPPKTQTKKVTSLPKHGTIRLTTATHSNQKKVSGYIYRVGNDYLVLNSEKGFIKDATAMKHYLEGGKEQTTNTYFGQPNVFAIAKDQVGKHAKLFKLAYGTVTYEELPENDRAYVSFAIITDKNIDELPKIKIDQIVYQVI
ncbi:conserved exported hypothetical protein [Latilactobacillus curvatus]|uniref:hypothetical protein n=1 Tax=Latilactobacillus curvatus TaxID=28038 RepID=UPI000A1B5762|nr:hypothetical protein [Latilactobacillus curvatus]SMH68565.1 conserved exported hypothetical protein [Latilactobacillus curvatus]